MSAVAESAILAGRDSPSGRLSDFVWRNPRILLLLMLTPPLLWLGVVYLGSLFALLLQSFFAIDDFSGLVNYEFTLSTARTAPKWRDTDWKRTAVIKGAPGVGIGAGRLVSSPP